MSDPELPEGSVVVGRIEIVEYLEPDGAPAITWDYSDGSGGGVDDVRLIGLLERTKLEIFADMMGDNESDQ
ncbi:hypothetical protein [Rhodococcus sp. PD04]|uniref:hypothetical protein n=1 Tax=Rhodococcus sp. PD04 TaxID=3109594 RepID=UPI002DD8E392|nr:hypothetical protein [Rhodococcus sp. PD04]WSE22343.1 hypothetical protein U9J23_22260 [Rhodococcus sp. PD04]